MWKQLQADKAAAIEERKQREEAIERARKELRGAQEAQKKAQGRLREAVAKVERAKKAAELKAKEEGERLRRQEEAKAQEKLLHMGVCPVGYHWIKQAGGYRCAGRSRFVTGSQLGLRSDLDFSLIIHFDIVLFNAIVLSRERFLPLPKFRRSSLRELS